MQMIAYKKYLLYRNWSEVADMHMEQPEANGPAIWVHLKRNAS